MLSSITETTCFSLRDRSVVQLKMSGTFEVTRWSSTPLKARLHLPSVTCLFSHSFSLSIPLSIRLSVFLSHSLSKAMTFKVTLIFLLLKHRNSISECSSLTKYNKTAQLHLRDKTSLCQCEGIVTQ